MDDSAETVLMRMRSGAPWYEWSGIPAVRSDILRPLLTVQREDLRAWVTAKRLPFHEDETNSELRFQRNRLRFKLRNCPEFWNRHQIHHFAASGEALEEALTAWRKMVYVLPVAIQKNLNEGTVGLAIDEIFRYFNNLTFLPVEVLWGWLNGQQDARLPSKLRRKISSFLSGKTPEAALLLPDGITLLRRGRQAWLVRNLARPIQMKVSMGTNRLPQYGGQLVINGERTDGAVPIRKDLLNHVLTLRTWHAGDHIKIARRPRKKISDLLAEMKLNPAQRARLLVLTDEQGPLMILGGAMDERALPDGTQGEVIWISWCEDESIGAGHVI